MRLKLSRVQGGVSWAAAPHRFTWTPNLYLHCSVGWPLARAAVFVLQEEPTIAFLISYTSSHPAVLFFNASHFITGGVSAWLRLRKKLIRRLPTWEKKKKDEASLQPFSSGSCTTCSFWVMRRRVRWVFMSRPALETPPSQEEPVSLSPCPQHRLPRPVKAPPPQSPKRRRTVPGRR